jgi:hypothetical protein
MRSLGIDILACACAALVLAGSILAQAEDAEQPQTIQLQPFHGPGVSNLTGFSNCQWLYPRDEPDEALLSEPAYGSAKRVYYAARYGDAKDNTYTFVIDESGGTGTRFDTLYVDLNNDNRLDPGGEKFPLTLSGRLGNEARYVRVTLSVSAGGKIIPYVVSFAAFPYKDRDHPIEKLHAGCRDSSIMVGEAVFEGRRCKVALADLNANGLFNDYEQDLYRGDRFFVDLNGDGSFSGRAGVTESFSYAQYAQIGVGWYTVEATPDGGTVHVRRAEPSFGTVKAPACIRSAGLTSARQFQELDLKDGRARALTGAYQVNRLEVEITDITGLTWRTRGTYRPGSLPLTIEPGQEAALPDVLPLTIRVAVVPTSESNTIELEPALTDACGGTFSILRKGRGQYEPPASLQIQDHDGRQVAELKLEYG